MDLVKFSRSAAVSVALAAASASPAFAQQTPAQGQPGAMPAQPAAAPQPDWVKICNTDPTAKKEICLVSRDVKADTGQTIASIAIRQVTGDKKKFFLAAVPPGLLIQPGVRVVVDQNAPQTGKYSICFPNACYAEVEVTDAVIANMKKGTNLVVQAMNQQAKTVNFPVGLSGFSKAYDGAAVDPKVVQAEQQKMNAELNKRAQDARDKLQQQGGAQAPANGGPAVPGGRAPTATVPQ
jgi:invasion protein IalB